MLSSLLIEIEDFFFPILDLSVFYITMPNTLRFAISFKIANYFYEIAISNALKNMLVIGSDFWQHDCCTFYIGLIFFFLFLTCPHKRGRGDSN
jgi:hypothetical protein